MKKMISALLAVLIVAAIMPLSIFAVAQTAEIPEGYTGVYDIEDLYMIRNNLSGSYILMNDIDLTEDLKDGGDWNEGVGWTPIGITATGCEAFTGVFDGNGHTLQGFRVNLASINSGYSGVYYGGLFGINEGTIKNINFTDVSVSVTADTKEIYFGVVCGKNTGTVSGCSINGELSFSFSTSNYSKYLSSCVGYNTGSISECNTSGTVNYNINKSESSSRSYFYGNIAGCSSTGSSINKCLSNTCSSLLLSLVYSSKYSNSIYYGGIAAQSSAKISECVNISRISVTLSGYYYNSNYSGNAEGNIGGIVGYLYSNGTITDCYNSGDFDIEAKNSYTISYSGGIAGYAYSGTISNVYNAGNISKTGSFGSFYCGGILGYNSSSSITNAYYLNTFEKGVGSGTDSCTSRTSTIMTKQGGFPGFDFDTVWEFYPCSGYKYPQLKAIPQDTSATDHFCKNPMTKIEPTCTEDGFISGLCDGCGAEFTQVLPALGHSFSDEETIDKEATCEEDGSKSRHCIRCDEKTDVTAIPATGHSLEEISAIPSTCTEDGNIKYYKCSVCGELFADENAVTVITLEDTVVPKGHTLVEISAKPATCTQDGNIKYYKCSVCGELFSDEKAETKFTLEDTVDPAKGHEAGEWVIEKQPSCTETGEKAKYCKNCGLLLEKQPVEKIAHAFGEWETTVAATCTENGEENRECAYCHEKETRTVVASGHSWNSEYTVDKEATCTESGIKSIHCSNCDATKGITDIPVLGHSFTNYIYNNDATAEKDGTETAKCDRCSETHTRTAVGTMIKPVAKPKVQILNSNKYNGKTVDYKTTITFRYIAENVPDGASVHWFVNGEDKGSGESYTVRNATSAFTVQAKIIENNVNVLAESETESINVKSGFFAKIAAFFKGLFGKLPVIEQ